MRKQLFKIASVAALMLALTSTSFAQESSSGGGFRLGLYGALPSGSGVAFTEGSSIGLLFDLGNNLEIGLGIAYNNYSSKSETEIPNMPTQTREENGSSWEIIPSVSYTLSKGDVVSYGAGLNIYLSSWSSERKQTGTDTITDEPDGMDMAFFPNFFIKAEPVKNFAVGLKAGLVYAMPGKEVDDSNNPIVTTRTSSAIGLGTELFLAFYL